MPALLWILTAALLAATAFLLAHHTHRRHVTPAGHALAASLGLTGRRSAVLLTGSVNAAALTFPWGQVDAAHLAPWSAGAAALSVIALLAAFGLSAWHHAR
ncbi:hypothetical protein [Deinococcus soli (ex Cha et al. 2016)]|uniref:hypothetical protein n=1 Tax=Deinococcus soli (ex Cha et al. 2016) TaxID=1309411 RepID=UPI00166483EB|nr:hypothetical protein [Deinococcus soli (ex Cha et al. 2016)]